MGNIHIGNNTTNIWTRHGCTKDNFEIRTPNIHVVVRNEMNLNYYFFVGISSASFPTNNLYKFPRYWCEFVTFCTFYTCYNKKLHVMKIKKKTITIIVAVVIAIIEGLKSKINT